MSDAYSERDFIDDLQNTAAKIPDTFGWSDVCGFEWIDPCVRTQLPSERELNMWNAIWTFVQQKLCGGPVSLNEAVAQARLISGILEDLSTKDMKKEMNKFSMLLAKVDKSSGKIRIEIDVLTLCLEVLIRNLEMFEKNVLEEFIVFGWDEKQPVPDRFKELIAISREFEVKSGEKSGKVYLLIRKDQGGDGDGDSDINAKLKAKISEMKDVNGTVQFMKRMVTFIKEHAQHFIEETWWHGIEIKCRSDLLDSCRMFLKKISPSSSPSPPPPPKKEEVKGEVPCRDMVDRYIEEMAQSLQDHLKIQGQEDAVKALDQKKDDDDGECGGIKRSKISHEDPIELPLLHPAKPAVAAKIKKKKKRVVMK